MGPTPALLREVQLKDSFLPGLWVDPELSSAHPLLWALGPWPCLPGSKGMWTSHSVLVESKREQVLATGLNA